MWTWASITIRNFTLNSKPYSKTVCTLFHFAHAEKEWFISSIIIRYNMKSQTKRCTHKTKKKKNVDEKIWKRMPNYLKCSEETVKVPDGKSSTWAEKKRITSNNKYRWKLFISKNKHILSFKFDDYCMYSNLKTFHR